MSLEMELELASVSVMIDAVVKCCPDLAQRPRIEILQLLRDCSYDIKLLSYRFLDSKLTETSILEQVASSYIKDTNLDKSIQEAKYIEARNSIPNGCKMDSKHIAIELKALLDSSIKQLEDRNKALASQAHINESLSEKINHLEKQLRDMSVSMNHKDASCNKLEHVVADLKAKIVQLESECRILQDSTDCKMFEFKSVLLEEKEAFIGRLRAQISQYQIQIRKLESEKRDQGETYKDLLHKIQRISIEYNHLKEGTSRCFEQLRSALQVNCALQITQALESCNMKQQALIDQLRVEKLYRKALVSQSSLSLGRARVFLRIKPLLMGNSNQDFKCFQVLSATDVLITKSDDIQTFQFDKVFAENSTQLQVYNEIKHSVPNILSGIHVGVFAFGQQGCGKSYTLFGAIANEGIIYQSLRDIFDQIKNIESGNPGVTIKVFFTACEVFNERGIRFI